jgi:phosphoadenosine phosphosulfate reductase
MIKISRHSARFRLDGLLGADMVSHALDSYRDRLALVSSFGAESAVLLHMAAQVSKDIPVIFLDTGKLFAMTHAYQADLASHLGLNNIRTVHPETEDIKAEDRSGALWREDPDRCCTIRKTWPLNRALKGFDAWITGRKKFQSTDRKQASGAQIQDGRLVLSPLLNWQKSELSAYFETHDLPPHPLVREGYPSIGCFTCTMPVEAGEDQRAGRWQGKAKTECGIHRPSLTSAA